MVSNDHDRLIPLAQAAALLPRRDGKRVHINTLHRWVKKGCRGVKLAAERVGGMWYVTPEELDRFCAALTEQCGGTVEPRETTRRQRVARARAWLKQEGFYGTQAKTKQVHGKRERQAKVPDVSAAG